jgi:beta-glucosidase
MSESFTGLWKFALALPGYGLLKAVIELEAEGDNVSGSTYIADQVEAELASITIEDDILHASCHVLDLDATITMHFENDRFTGLFTLGAMAIPIHGYQFEEGKVQDSILSKEDYDAMQVDLKNRKIVSITPPEPEEIAAKVKSLIKQMTLEEKIGQLCQINGTGAVTGPDTDIGDPLVLIAAGKVGSILNSRSAASTYALQRLAVDHGRLGIPLMFMFDVIHGFSTIFPIPLGMSCSWDTEAVSKAAHVAANEATVSGVNVTFAPMIDVARDPRWGRIAEGAGEDPFLGSRIAEAWVKGFQGRGIGAPDSMLACAKHMAAYGAPEGGREYNSADISEAVFRNVYLPPFKAAVKAGCYFIMPALNAINGVPATGNKHILDEILRKEWGFKGMVVSDYNAVMELITHAVAKDDADAAKQALDATVDIEMVSQAYNSNLANLVRERKVKESQIDIAVARILYHKFALGLFEDPYRFMDPAGEERLKLCAEHRAIARDVARRTIVLLKNRPVAFFEDKPVLPLDKDRLGKVTRIALIGPLASEKMDLLGCWSAAGESGPVIDLESGIRAKLEELSFQGIDLAVEKGCDFDSDKKDGFAAAIDVASAADIIILAMGEKRGMSGEAESRAHLNVPGVQEDLAREIKALGKPVVLVLFNGRPLVIPWFAQSLDAIIDAWFPGTEGGNAISDVLFGAYNPSAKLTTSFPAAEGQVPVHYARTSTGRAPIDWTKPGGWNTRYRDIPNDPLFPFGFGLSYTAFTYSNVVLDATTMQRGGSIVARVTITNTGTVAGEEIVQLYLRDVVGSLVRPLKELKGFQKIALAPRRSKDVTFGITEDLLGFYNNDGEWVVEPGDFIVQIGSSSAEGTCVTFTLAE